MALIGRFSKNWHLEAVYFKTVKEKSYTEFQGECGSDIKNKIDTPIWKTNVWCAIFLDHPISKFE